MSLVGRIIYLDNSVKTPTDWSRCRSGFYMIVKEFGEQLKLDREWHRNIDYMFKENFLEWTTPGEGLKVIDL